MLNKIVFYTNSSKLTSGIGFGLERYYIVFQHKFIAVFREISEFLKANYINGKIFKITDSK